MIKLSENSVIVFALPEESQDMFGDFKILHTGLGKVNAAHSLTQYIHQKRPDMIVNLGTAGSTIFQSGSVVNCNAFIQRDMDVTPLGFEKWKTPFSDDPAVLQYGQVLDDLHQGICGTGDSFEIDHKTQDYNVVDMEAYALALISKRENIPFLCLKYISDGADGNAAEDWNSTLKNAADALHSTLLKFTE